MGRLRGVFTAAEVAELRSEIDAVFESVPPERARDDKDEFRYEMLNRSAACQRAIANPAILEVIEPLLGDDCHVIANTAWRNPPEFPGGFWHCDAGPHVPRPKDVPWDDRIPYPVFAIGAHILLQDCTLADGPTAVVPGSHRSGRLAPFDRCGTRTSRTTAGRPRSSRAPPVTCRCSSRTCGTAGSRRVAGRAATSYRRTTAAAISRQRIRTTDVVNHLSPDAIERADTERARSLVGLHDAFFYDV